MGLQGRYRYVFEMMVVCLGSVEFQSLLHCLLFSFLPFSCFFVLFFLSFTHIYTFPFRVSLSPFFLLQRNNVPSFPQHVCPHSFFFSFQIDFSCPADGSTLLPTSWEATNTPGTCDYVYKLETCAVCKGGCSSGGSFGSIFCILLFFVFLPLYLIGGSAYQYQMKGKRGSEMLTSLWPTTFVSYVKDGIAFTANGCQGGGESSGSQSIAGSAQAESGGGGSSDGYQPYQNI